MYISTVTPYHFAWLLKQWVLAHFVLIFRRDSCSYLFSKCVCNFFSSLYVDVRRQISLATIIMFCIYIFTEYYEVIKMRKSLVDKQKSYFFVACASVKRMQLRCISLLTTLPCWIFSLLHVATGIEVISHLTGLSLVLPIDGESRGEVAVETRWKFVSE